MTDQNPPKQPSLPGVPAERFKTFVDAAIAIALTLLILPLMDSVGEAANEHHSAGEWLVTNAGQLTSFVLSFVIIAMFWRIHQSLFVRVERVDGALQWITFAWMLTIVWLPIATSVTSQLSDDTVNEALYVGSMILTCLLTLSSRLYLRAHTGLHAFDSAELKRGATVDLAMATLFAIALTVMILVPPLGYNPLLVLLLSPFAQKLFARILRVDAASAD